MRQPTVRSRSAVTAHPITSAAIAMLVAAAIFFTLYSPIYSRVTPKVGDFPFFYFYLLIFMPITSIALLIASQLQKRLRPPEQPAQDVPGAAAGEVAR
jgi:drug/metabolite transporter (DMT)-like permease